MMSKFFILLIQYDTNFSHQVLANEIQYTNILITFI